MSEIHNAAPSAFARAPSAKVPSPAERQFKARARMIDFALAQTGWARPVALVTGFWRSGTTWAQECMARTVAAKTIFEPLSPMIPAYERLIDPLPLHSYAARHAFLPHLRPGHDAEFWRYLDDAFRGYNEGDAALLCRKKVAESLSRRTVVKCVRMQLSLGAIADRYDVPVIHVRRHPGAVVASMLAARWDWNFEELRLSEILRGFGDGREDALGPLDETLVRYDTDALSRVAAYWALTERAVDEQLAGRPRARVIAYEEAVATPDDTFRDLAAFAGQPMRAAPDPNRDSPVTTAQSRKLTSSDRAEAWQSRLTPDQIRRIYQIVEAVFPAGLGDGQRRRQMGIA